MAPSHLHFVVKLQPIGRPMAPTDGLNFPRDQTCIVVRRFWLEMPHGSVASRAPPQEKRNNA